MWLRRWVGTAGPERLRTRDAARDRLRTNGATPPSLGLSGDDLDRIADQAAITAAAAMLPARGDATRLRQILWWGSALGDIASAPDFPGRRQVMQEAANFNLAVALFDSVVDQAPSHRTALANALTPRQLRRRLDAPGDPATAVHTSDPILVPVVGLFDEVLASAGARYAGDPAGRRYLGDLLDAMYRSELGLSRDPFDAKRLPVVFIGALAGARAKSSRATLFDALADFFWLWDDWLDLTEDLARVAPNAFLGNPRWPPVLGPLGYGARGVLHLGGGSWGRARLTRRVVVAIDAVLAAAGREGGAPYARTVTLLGMFLA